MISIPLLISRICVVNFGVNEVGLNTEPGAVVACHSSLSQLVIVAAGSILWGPWHRCRSRGLGPFQPIV